MRACASLAVVTLLLSACGYKQDDFAADVAQAHCAVLEECAVLDIAGYESGDTCRAEFVAANSKDGGQCANYDKVSAEACIDALNLMGCDDAYDDIWPASCDVVCGAAAG